MEEWLAASPDHQRVFDDLRQIRSDLQALPRPPLPHNFRDRVLSAIESRITSDAQASIAAPHETQQFPTHPPVAAAQPVQTWQWFSAGLAATLLIGFIALFSQPERTAYTLTQATPLATDGSTRARFTEDLEEQHKAITEPFGGMVPGKPQPNGTEPLLPDLARMNSSSDLQKDQLTDKRPHRVATRNRGTC